jgi:hypothetical protein
MTQAMDLMRGMKVGDFDPKDSRMLSAITNEGADLKTLVDLAHVIDKSGGDSGSGLIPFVIGCEKDGVTTVEELADYLWHYKTVWKNLSAEEVAEQLDKVHAANDDYTALMSDPLTFFQTWLERSLEKSHRPVEVVLAWKAISGKITRKEIELARRDYNKRAYEDTSDLVRLVAGSNDKFYPSGMTGIVLKHIWGETLPDRSWKKTTV